MTDKFLWNNKAITTLSGAHNNTTTTINLNPGDGALFPSPSSGEHFAVTIQATDGTAEVCYCTSRSVDALTVTRGQEASLGAPVAQTYVGGEAVELRVTAGTLNEFSQVTVAETITGAKTHTGKVIIIDGVADQEPPSILQSKLLGVMSATGAGTVDAITAVFAPVFAALTNGLTCVVRASGANTSATPTFKPDSLIAKTIVRYGNTALVAGDISAAGHELILRYNSTNDNWELMNPASVPTGIIDQTAIGPAAVGQGELITATATGSTSIPATSNASVTLTGGTHSWWTFSVEAAALGRVNGGNGNTAAGIIGLYCADSTARTFYRDERYVQASPPYDLGDGEIGLFIEILVDKNNKIWATNVAPDPAWAYHGPTIITPQKYDKNTRKGYRDYKYVGDRLLCECLSDKTLIAKIVSGEIEVKERRTEITHQIKNKDMNLYPHHFTGYDDVFLEDKTVLFIDPVGELSHRLYGLHEEGLNIRDLILAGDLLYDNEVLDRKAPKGVMVVKGSIR